MDSTTAEVAFLGRANVGKSSLINALLGALDAPIAHSSVRAGRTRLMNFYGLGCSGGSASATIQRAQESTVAKKWIRDGQVILVDTPGYGMSSNADVGEEIIKYLKSRKQ